MQKPGWPIVDARDFELVGALCQDPLATHEALARGIGRSASAVRKRLQSLHDAGILDGFVAVPDAGALQRKGLGVSWRVLASALDLLAIPGTVWAGTTIDGSSGALAYVHDTDAWLKAAVDTVGHDAEEVFETQTYSGPPLGRMDLRVLRAILEAPRADAVSLAEASGLSAKTVRKRREALLESGAVRIEPVIFGERSGSIMFQISTSCEPRLLPAVKKALVDHAQLPDIGSLHCILSQAPSLAEKAKRLQAIRDLGVDFVEVLLNDDFTWNTAGVVAIIDDEIAKWDSARR